MTKQPVIGTIIIGVLVVLQALWALAVAFEIPIINRFDSTQILIVTLLAIALLLIIVALWPKSAKKEEPLQYAPVSEADASTGITSRREDIVADLRWIDPSSALTVPITTGGQATVLVNPQSLAIRTAATNVDIGTDLGLTWLRQYGGENIYVSRGLTDPAQALLTVNASTTSLTVRSR